jgi:thiamine-phosphate pyrophosphorylase
VGRPLPPSPFLYAVVDASFLAGRPVGRVVAAVARGGAALVQLRAKDETDRRLLELAREALAAARAVGVPLVINDRADVARIVGADGVHVGQDDLSPRDVRAVLPGADLIVGVSTHGLAQLEAALAEPVDYVAVGPVFPTASKRSADPVVGTDLVRRARSRTDRVLVAIGGITRRNAAEVAAAGADGVAVISDLLSDPDPAAAARALHEALGAAGPRRAG